MSVRVAAAGSLAAALMLAACSSSGGGSSSQPPAGNPPASTGTSSGTVAGSAVTIASASTSKGTVLTVAGRTLYSFDPDTATTSKCTGACAAQWPPVIGAPTAGSGVDASGLTTITRADGTKQAVYDGHPLYEYSGDQSAGDVRGDGVEGTWHVVKASGDKTPASSNPAPSTSGGYNY